MKKETNARIRALRIKSRLTRDQVCSTLAIPFEEYVGIEEGRLKASEDFITDIINLYGVDRAHLVPKAAEIKEISFGRKPQPEGEEE